MEFITIHEVDYILSGDRDMVYKVLNEVFSRVYNKAVEDAMAHTPALAAHLIKTSSALQSKVEKFFTDNPDISKHRAEAKSVIQEIESKNPGIGYDEILKKSLPIIKAKIGILSKGDVPAQLPLLKDLDSTAQGVI